MPQAVLYTRVSSREQQQEGFSLEAQSRTLRDYAARGGYTIAATFQDVETAKTTGREAFSEMGAWLKRNQPCRVVLVEKTDRLYRDFSDAVTIEKLDVEVHLVKDGTVLSRDSKSQDKLIHGIHLVMAKSYIDNLREE